MIEIVIALVMLLIFVVLDHRTNSNKEHIKVPGSDSRYEIEANFYNDRAEFEANEVKFYSRYKT